MGAIDYLLERGFTARKQGMRVRISPASKLTEDIRKYVKANRLALLAELAANDGVERCCHWQVMRDGKRLCTMVGEPMTRAEALEIIHWRWPDAELG